MPSKSKPRKPSPKLKVHRLASLFTQHPIAAITSVSSFSFLAGVALLSSFQVPNFPPTALFDTSSFPHFPKSPPPPLPPKPIGQATRKAEERSKPGLLFGVTTPNVLYSYKGGAVRDEHCRDSGRLLDYVKRTLENAPEKKSGFDCSAPQDTASDAMQGRSLEVVCTREDEARRGVYVYWAHLWAEESNDSGFFDLYVFGRLSKRSREGFFAVDTDTEEDLRNQTTAGKQAARISSIFDNCRRDLARSK